MGYGSPVLAGCTAPTAGKSTEMKVDCRIVVECLSAHRHRFAALQDQVDYRLVHRSQGMLSLELAGFYSKIFKDACIKVLSCNHFSNKWGLAMSDKLKDLEKILGGEIEQLNARRIPGSVAINGVEVVYYQDDGRMKRSKLFKVFLDGLSSRSAKSGGRVSDSCSITSPDNLLFHAMSYHGEIVGWRKDIEEAAKGLGLLLARIEGESFIVSDGRYFPLSECRIDFN